MDESSAIVSRWLEAFNTRDLDGMLACLDPDVRLRPLKLNGVGSAYHGHDGVRRWARELVSLRHEHRIDLTTVRGTDDGRVLAVGAVDLPEQPAIAPFCALYEVTDGVIVVAHHYLSDPDLLEQIGMLR